MTTVYDPVKHYCLSNIPDEHEAEGPFEIRPEWLYEDADTDSWEVARPTTPYGEEVGRYPGPICLCTHKEHAEAIRDALNAFTNPAGRLLAR
ncbi:hypothetical protein ROA7450_03358 [Roseovarius albus]|uniref:Uncharacterized protein n=1 Tax=Roseovarius albus TaxID=1247867 RepID=A0A1X6ZX47_9RHOB|nr:hypothetical protein [Roseovarius albus]SLN63909.1 hypothetical protein ROA7450_03358 [Roseovarius albus]